MSWKVFVLASSTALSIALAACMGDSDEVFEEPPANDIAVPTSEAVGANLQPLAGVEISHDQLSRMALTKEDLGRRFTQFEADGESGFITNDDAIEGALDCEDDDTAEDIDRFGQLIAYDQSYILERARAAGVGTFLVGSDITLYETGEGAQGDVEDGREEAIEFVGTTCADVTLLAFDEFEVGPIGDVSLGAVVTISFPSQGAQDIEIFSTSVLFVLGPIAAGVSILGFQESDDRAVVIELAQTLRDRITSVLEDAPASTAGGDGDPIALLQGKMLRSEDMPVDWALTLLGTSTFGSEEMLRDMPTSAGVDRDVAERRLDSWGFVFGQFREYGNFQDARGVTVQVFLHKDARGAENAFIDGALLGGFDPALDVEQTSGAVHGDESVLYRISGEVTDYLPGLDADIDGLVLQLRVGRFLAAITVHGPAGEDLRPELDEMAQLLASRLEP